MFICPENIYNTMTLTKEKKEALALIVVIIGLTTLCLSIFMYDSYQTEQETLNNAYSSLNLQHPTYNETTRFFETECKGNIYIGYIEFNTTKESTIKITEFTNYTNTLIIGNRVLYVSDNNTIIYQKNINRRFN